MGKIALLIQKTKEDKESFQDILCAMEPLIKKYTKTLYKDEKEDVRSELILALWEAVVKIEYYEDEGQCILFLCIAIKNKFYELYRNSKKWNDNQTTMEVREDQLHYFDEDMDTMELKMDMESILDRYSGKKKEILLSIIFENKSDVEIGKKYHMSRQYVNRLRRELRQILEEEYLQH